MAQELGPFSIDRVVSASNAVRARLSLATSALEAATVQYAVTGDQAVAWWVSRADRSAVRNTPEVEILVNRDDLGSVSTALEGVGFRFLDPSFFVEGTTGRQRDAVSLIFTAERTRPAQIAANPPVSASVLDGTFRTLPLDAIVSMQLADFRTVNQVHIQDLISVGLIDSTWPSRLPPELASRLQSLLDDPNG
jgi:hypothetical protein